MISILRGLLGIVFLLFCAWLLSKNRKKIDFQLVWKALVVQLVLALLVLKVPFVDDAFSFLSGMFVKLISFSEQGANFLFRSFFTGEVPQVLENFAVRVLPTIVFFSALTAMLYYFGLLQKVVYYIALGMKKIMRLSGPESLSMAGNIFLGQTESPLLIRPYLGKMTRSELSCLMTGGMATIAGGVLAAYIGFLGGDSPEEQAFFARHLLTASLMSAPAAILFSKILIPETETFSEDLKISRLNYGKNLLESISTGTTEGLKLAINVAAMLLVFISLIALFNAIANWGGDVLGINTWIQQNTNYDGLSFQFILGYLLAPVAWVLGVPASDMVLVGQLVGEKTILNEFVAYVSMGELVHSDAFKHEKSVVMATYMLCGFSNFASIGIQLGGIGALIPGRKSVLAEIALRALVAATLACLLTGAVVGMFL